MSRFVGLADVVAVCCILLLMCVAIVGGWRFVLLVAVAVCGVLFAVRGLLLLVLFVVMLVVDWCTSIGGRVSFFLCVCRRCSLAIAVVCWRWHCLLNGVCFLGCC